MASKTGLPSSLNSSSSDNSKPEGEVTVKQERKDSDAEPPKKAASSSATRTPNTTHASTASTAPNPALPAAEVKAKQVAPVEKGPPPLDFASIRGIFGWMTVAGVNLPFIVRGDQRYVAVRMVECKIISKFSDILPWAVFTCTNIKSYYITDNEAKLLNEINGYHCDHQFGYSLFSTKDVVVSVEDAVRFQRFLAVCKAKLVPSKDSSPSLLQACGLLRIHGAIIPYLTKNSAKVVPISLLKEGVTAVKCFASGMGEWDLAYVKVLCYVAGIDAQNKVVVGSSLCSVDDLRYSHSGQTVHFEEWWPSTFPQYLSGANQQMPSGGAKMPSLVQDPHGKHVVNNYNGFTHSPGVSEMTKVSYHISSRPDEYQASLGSSCGCIGNCHHVPDRRGAPLLNNSMVNGTLRGLPASGYWDQSHQSLPLQAANGGIASNPCLKSHLGYGDQHLQSYQEKSAMESSLTSKSYPPPPPLVRLGKIPEDSQPLTSPTGDRLHHAGGGAHPALRPPPPLQPAPTISIGKTTVFRDSTRTDMPVIVGVHSLASERAEAASADGRLHKDMSHLSPKTQGPVVAPHHYPTPPQSSPLQSSTPVPVSLTDSSFQPPFIMHPCDFVDLCSPPASPETRHANGPQETVAVTNRLPPLLPFIDIEGSLLPTINLDPTNPSSTLLTSISAVVSKLFPSVPEQSCQFVLENVLGVKLYSSSR